MTFAPDKIADALETIRAASQWLQERARDAGLPHPWVVIFRTGSQKHQLGIKIQCGNATFPGTRSSRRAVSWANAYSLEEFDQVVASGLAYLANKRSKK